MTEHLFLIWSILANVMAYGGCIGQRKSNRKIWRTLTIALMMLAVGFVEENLIASAVCTGLMMPVAYMIHRESGQKKK